MKVDRRSFLAFIIGGAAGTALTPLPWKLTDDLAIWSQNWPWTPVPEKGEISYVGISVKKAGERVIKIAGLQGHPVNEGGLCILGSAGAQLLYGPTRIQTPIKKINGRWQKILWEEAVTEIAAKLKELRANGSAHTVACVAGSDRGTVPELLNRFPHRFGTPMNWRYTLPRVPGL
jgi:anaerobic selenocysteine-containing dehydrogenase